MILVGPRLMPDHSALLDGPPARIPAADAALRLRHSLEAHFALVWRSLRRLGVPSGSIDDAAQHVFLVLVDHLGRIPPGRERGFLLSTAVRVAANARRKQARSPEMASDELDREADRLPNPEQLLDWKQRREALDRALAELPFDQRAVFVLFELEGFSLPEIAETLGVPLGTATSRLRRARLAFETWVSRQQENGAEP